MTIMDYLPSRAPAAKPPSALGSLKAMWLTFKWRREIARTVMELSRLDPHLLRDVGIEPLDAYEAFNARQRSILWPIASLAWTTGTAGNAWADTDSLGFQQRGQRQTRP